MLTKATNGLDTMMSRKHLFYKYTVKLISEIQADNMENIYDFRSVEEKVNYAKSKGLAGVMLWGIENDDFKALCDEKYPLLNAINKAYKQSQNVNCC